MKCPLNLVRKADPVHFLVAERLNGPYVRNALVDIGADISQAVLAEAAKAADAPTDDNDRHDNDWHDEDDQAGELCTRHREHDRSTYQQQHIPQRHGGG